MLTGLFEEKEVTDRQQIFQYALLRKEQFSGAVYGGAS